MTGLPWAERFAEIFEKYIDGFIPFPGFPGLPEQDWKPGSISDYLLRIQDQHFDLALQMHGDGKTSNFLVSLFGAREVAGFYVEGRYRPSEKFFPYPFGDHEINRNLTLLSKLGLRPAGEQLEFPLSQEDRAFAMAALGKAACTFSPRSYICVHPGSRSDKRRWSPEHFARVADQLGDLGYTICLTGTGRETDIVADVISRMKRSCVDTSKFDFDLTILATLFQGAALLVCNDTGVSHLAAALSIPSVVVFTASDANRWAPLNISLHSTVNGGDATSVVEVVRKAKTFLLKEEIEEREVMQGLGGINHAPA